MLRGWKRSRLHVGIILCKGSLDGVILGHKVFNELGGMATGDAQQVMHHKDPMRCPIAMLGLYFAFQFFQLQDELPTMASWLS